MGEEPENSAPPGDTKRSLNDFAYLFLTRPGENRANGKEGKGVPPPGDRPPGPPPDPPAAPALSKAPEKGSSPEPPAETPGKPPSSPTSSSPSSPPSFRSSFPSGRFARSAAFLGSGEGWLRTFLAAETALYLSREGFPVQVAQEGGLFPTVSGHLGRLLGRKKGGALSIRVTQAGPALAPPENPGFLLVEIPAHLPRWAPELMAKMELLVLAVPLNPAGRIRAFHQLKRILRLLPSSLQVGVVAVEKPGSGGGRETFHRFLAAQGSFSPERIFFLGALPLEPALEKVFLAERKPALVWSPGSLAAAALGRIGAAILRRLQPQEAAG